VFLKRIEEGPMLEAGGERDNERKIPARSKVPGGKEELVLGLGGTAVAREKPKKDPTCKGIPFQQEERISRGETREKAPKNWGHDQR